MLRQPKVKKWKTYSNPAFGRYFPAVVLQQVIKKNSKKIDVEDISATPKVDLGVLAYIIYTV